MADPRALVLALALDLVAGDPRQLPHPVVAIGRFISLLERFLRRILPHELTAGVLLMLITICSAGAAAYGLLMAGTLIHPFAALLVSIYLSWTCLAIHSLHRESSIVAAALREGDLPLARNLLSRIVGRDTDSLEEQDIWRALVETVSENTSDGIIAPLFWLTIGGPVGGMVYKAASTLDSMVGYKNDRYRYMGWASARMDDLLNFIPARLTALLMIVTAPLCGLSFVHALKITLRDRRNHPSPNSGHPEAAAAGALGVRLGGAATYHGAPSWKQEIGDMTTPLDERAYRGSIRLMYSTSAAMAVACILVAATLGRSHSLYV